MCDGASVGCPGDVFADPGTVCRPTSAPCDEEEVDVAEGEVNVPEFEGAVFEVVAKWDCEILYCGRLQVRDEYGNVIDTSEIHLDEEFVEDATPADMSFHHVHVGCRLRGYFAPVEGSDGVTRDGFYVQEFL